MILLQLAYEFFKIGLFSFGGGYATIPFLYYISQEFAWYSIDELTQMFAIASITPGPVGINVATYAGLKTAGILGSLVATISEMIPSLILVIIVSKLLTKFSENFYVRTVLEVLKPLGCALLVSVFFNLLSSELTTVKSLIVFIVLLLLGLKTKKDPLFIILTSMFLGILVVISPMGNLF